MKAFAAGSTLGVFASQHKAGVAALLEELIRLADTNGICVRMTPPCAEAIGRRELGHSDEEIAATDAVVTFSGSGGVLKAARATAPFGTPILAIDLGDWDFLSTARATELEEVFTRLLSGQLVVEERMMLDVRILKRTAESPGQYIPGDIGLNDAVVANSALSRILRLAIYIDGNLMAETRADGLVISTPTGSTAYAMAAKGPIVFPDVPLMVMCSICAHSLQQRPLIVDHRSVIDIQADWEGDEVPSAQLQAMLTIDGQVALPLSSGDVVRVRRSDCVTRLLQKTENSFHERFHQKIGWGS